MKIVFLGTGTSTGVPSILHKSPKVNFNNQKNWRTRCALHVVLGQTHIQIDAGPEFRLQCLSNYIQKIDLFILTHGHADHILGMDDLRSFCGQKALKVFSTSEGLERIKMVFPYAIRNQPEYETYPAFELHLCPKTIDLPDGLIHTYLLPHGTFQTLGLVFEDKRTGARAGYFNDCKDIPQKVIQSAQGIDLAILDGLRSAQPHPTHMTIEEAIQKGFQLKAKQIYLTHLAGSIDYETFSKTLPNNVYLAYDQLQIIL